MFENVLSENAKKSLALLGKSKILKNAYMAGGTALAFPDFNLDRTDWGTILGSIGSTRFSLFFYNYPLLFKTNNFLGVDIADIKDIAPMKIAAISDRVAKKRFC